MDYIHVSDFVEDRPVVPWFAFPLDPMVAEDKPLVPGEIATGANYFADLAASNSQCARRTN